MKFAQAEKKVFAYTYNIINLQWGLEWWISLSTVNSALPLRKLGTQHSRLSIEKKQCMTNWMTAGARLNTCIKKILVCQTHYITYW